MHFTFAMKRLLAHFYFRLVVVMLFCFGATLRLPYDKKNFRKNEGYKYVHYLVLLSKKGINMDIISDHEHIQKVKHFQSI